MWAVFIPHPVTYNKYYFENCLPISAALSQFAFLPRIHGLLTKYQQIDYFVNYRHTKDKKRPIFTGSVFHIHYQLVIIYIYVFTELSILFKYVGICQKLEGILENFIPSFSVYRFSYVNFIA